jgi:hypothetical protein
MQIIITENVLYIFEIASTELHTYNINQVDTILKMQIYTCIIIITCIIITTNVLYSRTHHGSATLVRCVSSCRISCVLRAIFALNSVGSPREVTDEKKKTQDK